MKLNLSSSALRRKGQQGLTLIELLIVLVVLVGVAGILVPLFPDVRVQTHGATGADNIKEISKSLTLHQVTNGVYPDDFDSLVDDAGAAIEVVDGTHYALQTLTADQVTAITGGGITNLIEHDSGSTNATFDPYADPTPVDRPINETEQVVTLTPAGADELGLDNAATYLVVGVGALNTGIGESALDAAVHFPEEHSPVEDYGRFLAVFEVGESLRLAAVAAAHDGEVVGLGGHLEEYYEATFTE